MRLHTYLLGTLVLGLAASVYLRTEAAPTTAFANSAGKIGTVDLVLESPSDGNVIAPFDVVTWSVDALVSPSDNLGLALISFDFIQDETNPELIDIPRANGVTPAMTAFDRPNGFTNPGAAWQVSGYGGTPVGKVGTKNRVQIGGMQNTSGVAGPTFGPMGEISYGQKLTVDSGVGQSAQGEEITSGAFRAPGTPGVYVYRIQNGLANVLTEVNAAPQVSKTSPATVNLTGASIQFTVQ